MGTTLLEVRNVKKWFPVHGGFLKRVTGHVHSVDGVSFDVAEGEILSIVGESGCGKSTLSRLILQLMPLTEGEIRLGGERIDALPERRRRRFRERVQIIFQDPMSSLNPRMQVRDIVAEPLRNFRLVASKTELDERVGQLLEKVGLPREMMSRYPHEFSGGQRQRIGIARALAPNPRIVVCDEAVSALDVSVKAQIINLLMNLQAELGLALIFISHDLALVEHISHRIAVMYLGKIVECGETESVLSSPRHPYTRALLAAVPQPDPDAEDMTVKLTGEIPSPIHLPQGCRFHTRCPSAFDRCAREEPVFRQVATKHLAACHLND